MLLHVDNRFTKAPEVKFYGKFRSVCNVLRISFFLVLHVLHVDNRFTKAPEVKFYGKFRSVCNVLRISFF